MSVKHKTRGALTRNHTDHFSEYFWLTAVSW